MVLKTPPIAVVLVIVASFVIGAQAACTTYTDKDWDYQAREQIMLPDGSGYYETSNPADCCTVCGEVIGCGFWSYEKIYSDIYGCFLYKSKNPGTLPNLFGSGGVIAGVIDCGNSATSCGQTGLCDACSAPNTCTNNVCTPPSPCAGDASSCGQPGSCVPCSGATPDCVSDACGVRNDPIIRGFDGKEFHFDEIGDFTLLEEGDGWRIDNTFAAAQADDGEVLKEVSWTRGVRIYSPSGDMISFTLPYIKPNTSVVQVTAVSAGASDSVSLSATNMEVDFGDMTARAVLTDAATPQVWAVEVTTPKMVLTVKQMWGWQQAQIDFELEAWAQDFTWLNVDFQLRKQLSRPITGILGATYPLELSTESNSLRPESEPVQLTAASIGSTRTLANNLELVATVASIHMLKK